MIVRAQIAFVPPRLDSVLGRSQQFNAGQFIALLILVYVAMCRQKIPEIVARPRSPWETVVNIESFDRKSASGPDTIQFV